MMDKPKFLLVCRSGGKAPYTRTLYSVHTATLLMRIYSLEYDRVTLMPIRGEV